MVPASLVGLHVGHGPELTLMEYLYRVLPHLLGFGGTAVLAFGWLRAVEAVRSARSARRDDEEDERERWRTSRANAPRRDRREAGADRTADDSGTAGKARSDR